MSAVTLNPAELSVELTTAEKLAGLHGDLVIPLSSITSVEVVPDALAGTHGLRAPGLALPGVRKIGTWRSRQGTEFVIASRGQAGVRLGLAGHKHSSVLIGDDDAEGLAERIRAAR